MVQKWSEDNSDHVKVIRSASTRYDSTYGWFLVHMLRTENTIEELLSRTVAGCQYHTQNKDTSGSVQLPSFRCYLPSSPAPMSLNVCVQLKVSAKFCVPISALARDIYIHVAPACTVAADEVGVWSRANVVKLHARNFKRHSANVVFSIAWGSLLDASLHPEGLGT